MPVVSAFSAPASICNRAFRLKLPREPALARGHRIGGRDEPCARAAVGNRSNGFNTLPVVMTIGPGGHRDLAGLDLGAHPALGQLGAGVAGHGFDLGRDLGYKVDALGIGVGIRGRGVEAVDVGQQNEAIGGNHRGDTGGQAVVVAVADLGSRHSVVFVDDGNGLQGKKRLQGVARIEIAATLLRVAEGQEDLGDGQSPLAPELLVGVGETDLPDRGRGLALLQRERTFGQPELWRPSAMEPEETSTTSLPALARPATSSISDVSHACLSAPFDRSARSAEPILTTTRRATAHSGRATGPISAAALFVKDMGKVDC